MKFNLICASHNDVILNKNLAASLFFKNNSHTVVKGYSNIPKAYNLASKICSEDEYKVEDEYNVFVHHDVFMPPEFFQDNLEKSILQINSIDPNWGVLGVVGAILENGQRKFPGYLLDRGKVWGTLKELPHEVQTLDELLLITRGDFIFDEQFPLHFYGADICLQAIAQGRKNYAINAYCHHNSTLKVGVRSNSFFDCQTKFKNKWKGWLPVITTCTLIQ